MESVFVVYFKVIASSNDLSFRILINIDIIMPISVNRNRKMFNNFMDQTFDRHFKTQDTRSDSGPNNHQLTSF